MSLVQRYLGESREAIEGGSDKLALQGGRTWGGV